MLCISGEPGLGKTALLHEIALRAVGFSVLSAEGTPSPAGRQLRALGGWGLDPATRPVDPFQAAQRLREIVDARQHTGPVLLVLDDAQWIDPASAQTIGWLLRRSDRDRLLVALAARPPRAGADPAEELTGSGAETLRLELTGLSEADAAVLVRRVRPAAEPALIARLWRHTAGHPLHLRGLVTEYPTADLARMEPLPAPSDLVRVVTDRLRALSPHSVTLAEATAALGPAWVPLADATELAGLAEPEPTLRVLDESGLIETRPAGAGTEIRIPHPVVGAAILRQTPLARRRSLHLMAAGLVRSPTEALRHRVAAVERYDDDLADELDRQAALAHRAGDHHRAATLLRWSGTVTRSRNDRERRWLDGLFESVLARDLTEVDESTELPWASDGPRRALVQGSALIARRRLVAAVDALESPSATELSQTDPHIRHGLQTMLAWALVMTGAPVDRVVGLLDAVERDPEPDPALAGYRRITRGQVRMRTPGRWERWGMVADVPSGTGVPPTDSYALAWRGTVYTLAGRLDDGIADLREFVTRVRDGTADIGDGMFHAVLGYGLWLRGDPDRARIPIGVAAESGRTGAGPFVQAIAPLRTLDGGDPAAARRQLGAAFDDIRAAPLAATLHVAGVVGGVIELLDDSAERQRTFLPDLRRALGDRLVQLEGPVSPLWELHLGLAAVWCGDLDLAAAAADRLDRGPAGLDWRPAGVRWIRGQIALTRGDPEAADRELRAAADAGLIGLPFHQARLTAIVDALAATPRPAPASDDPLAVLSDRERDVVALMSEGLSYAQIARELYLSRGTVAFHLSNAYAKTGTTGRHQLVALVRAAHR